MVADIFNAAPSAALPACGELDVLVIADADRGALSELDRRLVGAARAIASERRGSLFAVAWQDADPQELACAGADVVLVMPPAEHVLESEMVALALPGGCGCYVFPDTVGRGADCGRRFAAAKGERPISGVVAIRNGRALRMGSAGLDWRPLGSTVFLKPDYFEATAREGGADLFVSEVRAACLFRVLSTSRDKGETPLEHAEFVMVGGNGVSDWDSFHRLARRIGAIVGGTRAVCDRKILPRDRQIGTSGRFVAPRVYLGIGVSGAPQHLQGLQRCDQIIAVNIDPYAPLMRKADIALVADSGAFMTALHGALGT